MHLCVHAGGVQLASKELAEVASTRNTSLEATHLLGSACLFARYVCSRVTAAAPWRPDPPRGVRETPVLDKVEFG